MTQLDDFYEVLGLSRGATKQELRAAYLDLVKVWHPDRFANESERLQRRAEEQLKKVITAYRVLEHDAARAYETSSRAANDSPGTWWDNQRSRAAQSNTEESVSKDKQHQEALRFVRLLVSSIKLYNEHLVAVGRATRRIYSCLKHEIELSRKLYVERIPDTIRATTNYFDAELVRMLADGDEGAMGSEW